MNRTIAKIIGTLPIRPVDSIWFDVTGDDVTEVYSEWIEKTERFEFKDPIEKIPLPFDRMGIVIGLDMTGITKNNFNDVVPYPVVIERNKNVLTMKTYYVGFKTHVNEIVFENGMSGPYKVIVNPEYKAKFGHIPNFFDASNYDDIIRSVNYSLILLSYGIPNKGKQAVGFKPFGLLGNEKRLKKGKPQLFEWKTVLIENKPEPVSVSLGGTHASPKPHERRGHQRRYKNGKVVYIKSMTINRHKIPTEGFIHHDYKVVSQTI